MSDYYERLVDEDALAAYLSGQLGEADRYERCAARAPSSTSRS